MPSLYNKGMSQQLLQVYYRFDHHHHTIEHSSQEYQSYYIEHIISAHDLEWAPFRLLNASVGKEGNSKRVEQINRLTD